MSYFICKLLRACATYRIELAKCIANPSCAANVACLQTCNNRPDETECQVNILLIHLFLKGGNMAGWIETSWARLD